MDSNGIGAPGPIACKRGFDLVVGIVLLALTTPILILTAIGLKLASPGPILYRAKRVGQGGEIFTMHKFRTMHVDADKKGPAITGPDDPRLFPLGEILRKTKFDELPQLVDVLRGRMSIVGPRPEDPDIVEKYYTPRQMQTLRVKPGLTSPAAIYFSEQGDERMSEEDLIGSYVDNVLGEKLEMELDYIERAGVAADLRIIGASLLYVLKVIGGYIAGPFRALRK